MSPWQPSLAALKTLLNMPNFARFYELARRTNTILSTEEFKTMMVLQYTQNRTFHLHEMTTAEYNALCSALQKQLDGNTQTQILQDRLRRSRGRTLHLLQDWGIDTRDRQAVDRFCLQPRIAGQRFARLDTAALSRLQRKLQAMIKARAERQAEQEALIASASSPLAPIIPLNPPS